MSVRVRIFEAMQQIAEEQKVVLPPLEDDLLLHETGFDSRPGWRNHRGGASPWISSPGRSTLSSC
jgi:hypothetical protein